MSNSSQCASFYLPHSAVFEFFDSLKVKTCRHAMKTGSSGGEGPEMTEDRGNSLWNEKESHVLHVTERAREAGERIHNQTRSPFDGAKEKIYSHLKAQC